MREGCLCGPRIPQAVLGSPDSLGGLGSPQHDGVKVDWN